MTQDTNGTAVAVREPEQARDIATIDLSAIERVIVSGDLSKLSPNERWDYYRGVCQSVGLNPFTKPFEYITLNNKLTLYALKGATDQLRRLYGISITPPKVDLSDGLCMVTVSATDRTGRVDSELGIVTIERLTGESKANAIMKAITKAKRRVTLSMCGLGMLDETEAETIPNARTMSADDAHAGQAAPEPTPADATRAAAMVTGADPGAESIADRWARLLAEAETVGLDGLARLRAIDTKAVGPSQLKRYADQLDARLAALNADSAEAF